MAKLRAYVTIDLDVHEDRYADDWGLLAVSVADFLGGAIIDGQHNDIDPPWTAQHDVSVLIEEPPS